MTLKRLFAEACNWNQEVLLLPEDFYTQPLISLTLVTPIVETRADQFTIYTCRNKYTTKVRERDKEGGRS